MREPGARAPADFEGVSALWGVVRERLAVATMAMEQSNKIRLRNVVTQKLFKCNIRRRSTIPEVDVFVLVLLGIDRNLYVQKSIEFRVRMRTTRRDGDARQWATRPLPATPQTPPANFSTL